MAKAPVKDNQFDQRRETLVVEQKTTWPTDLDLPHGEKVRIATLLHASPSETKKLDYVRCPSGMIRHITVTQEDLDRLKAASEA
ncbi:hypothetical protein Pan216_47450 [Planctomycetes bacterium Pan216]|uniref:Uncharacterized protein n=1 Tax=Kolteria novifilia TaxID=2527975 RepID=A0A518BA59_9BACT|nr:hypothetical protein Pan216_47450 [Planctomycetes bacterium Pan216]